MTTYVIPNGAMSFWKQRLEKFQIPFTESERFGEQYVKFEDPHGLQLEIVEREAGKRNTWQYDDITPDVAIKGFGGAILYSTHPKQTAELLEKVMGLDKVDEDGEFIRYRSTSDLGNIVDLAVASMGMGEMGVGTVHHIAWRANDDQDQLDWKKHVEQFGYFVTPVQDRNYFNAIYFREHGKILFEIATDPPGFAHDESYETMGEKLMLPARYEPYREHLERTLIPISVKS